MPEKAADVISYFQAPRDYFWHWAENGSVIEFVNGRTIVYREDLLFMLNSLELPEGIPLGAVLSVLCACKDNYETLFAPHPLLRQFGSSEYYSQAEHNDAKQMISQTLRFMKVVNAVPFEYRSGLARIKMLQAILGGDAVPKNTQWLKALNNQLRSGSLDEPVFKEFGDFGFGMLIADLTPLMSALSKFPDAAALEMQLRTGLSQIPVKADILLPVPVPEDLMAELAADLKTSGLAKLSKKISAALNIPMHLSGSSDQSIGGVSDISNRGHYDKLLLSELAQDDLLLTARLANNEALFLQRERLPQTANPEWHIMLDITLKMWGLPRTFGLATALAFSEAQKHGQLKAFALGGKQTVDMDLGTKDGIIQTLEKLDPALNCGTQLKKLMKEQASPTGKYVLVTGAHYKDDVTFMADYIPLKDQLDYVVEIGRDGHIALYATKGKKHRLVNQALIDMEETLFDTKKRAKVKANGSDYPAMLGETDFPLYFPASKIKLKHDNTLKMGSGETCIVTRDRRVLCWTSNDKGATELIPQLDFGDYFMGQQNEYLFVLVKNAGTATVTIYQVDMTDKRLAAHTLKDIKARDIKFSDGLFYLWDSTGFIAVDPKTGKTVPAVIDADQFKGLPVIPHLQLLNQIRKLINNGYSAINSAKKIYAMGALFIDERELKLDKNGRDLSLIDNPVVNGKCIMPVKHELVEITHLPYVKFTRFKWADGSEAVHDSRGLLHLKSSDTSIPECTIILIVDKTTACWASDGKITGSPYFTGNKQVNVMLAADFYNAYIEPFIKALK